MAMTREQLMQRLLDSYAGSYDLEREVQDAECPELVSRAHFYVDESAYMISKKAVMYSTNSDEFVWFFSVSHLTDEICERCIQYAYDKGMPLVDPDRRNHMVSRLVAVFVCDDADENALERIKKCRIYKSFQFSLKGWMEFHTAAADLGKGSAVANRFGRLTGEHLKNLMDPNRKKGSPMRRFLRSIVRRG